MRAYLLHDPYHLAASGNCERLRKPFVARYDYIAYGNVEKYLSVLVEIDFLFYRAFSSALSALHLAPFGV